MKYLSLLLLTATLFLSACAKQNTQSGTANNENLLTTCNIDNDCKKLLACEKIVCANGARRNLLIQEDINNQCEAGELTLYKPPSLGECKCINSECQFE